MRQFSLVLLVLLGFSVIGCGGRQAQLANDLPEPPPESAADTTGLPSLDSLNLNARGASLVGPGWVEFQPTDVSHAVSSFGTTPLPGGALTIDGSVDMAWAIFGVTGFDTDCFPTSVRVTAGNVADYYHVAFANYGQGAWVSSEQFNGSAEIVYPATDGSFTIRDYLSPNNVAYFAVIAPLGDSLDVITLALGVHGGDDPPLPVSSFNGEGGENGLSLTWLHSGNTIEPDFLGYYLERAPLLSGDYVRFTPEPILIDHYLDNTVVLGEPYRYRIAAVDVTGNLSPWNARIFATLTGHLADPVAVLNMPEGPLYGPVEVTFDMSDSFDPEGDVIDNYRLLADFGEPNYSGIANSVTIMLQPGCYEIGCEVKVGPRRGWTYRMLKIYPQWQETSAIVRDTLPGFSRALQYRAAQDPATGEAVFFSFDMLVPGAAAWILKPGGEFELLTLPTNDLGIYYMGEPLVVDGAILVPYNVEGAVYIARFESGAFEWIIADIAYGAGGAVSLIADGDNHVWILYNKDVAGSINLYLRKLFDAEPDVEVATNIGVSKMFDSEWNATAAAIDIVYAHGAGTSWARYHPETAVFTNAVVALDSAEWIDLEINPENNRPALLYRHTLRQRYRELNPDEATWSLGIIIDNSADSSWQGDLVAANGQLYATFSRDALATRLYERTGGVWSSIAEVDYGGIFGLGIVALHPLTPTTFALADIDSAGTTHLGVVNTGGAYTDELSIPAVNGQQQWLHATAGDPGLHMVFGIGSALQHSTSPDGVVWTAEAGFGVVSGVDLTSTTNGEVFLSYVQAGNAKLEEWLAPGWGTLQTQVIATDCAPLISEQPNSMNFRWAMIDNVLPATFHIYTEKNFSSHLTPSVSTTPIWTGTYVQGVIYNPDFLVVAGGADPGAGDVGFLQYDGGSVGFLYEPWRGYFGNRFTDGKEITSSNYNFRGYPYPLPVYWVAYGPNFSPVRITKDTNGIVQVTELPGMPDPYNVDMRRSVSAAKTWGGGALGLIASFDGQLTWFEWDNFGYWEDLPLPEGLDYARNHEIVVGMDGRWHIIYHNLITDQILCRSTI